MATMVKLQTVTVGSGGASSIDFTNIPQTYRDLKIVVSSRSTRATGETSSLSMVFNSNTTGYTNRNVYGDGTSALSNNNTYTASGFAGYTSQDTDTANIFSNVEIYIPNYTSSNNKSWSADAVKEKNATTSYLNMTAGLWSNTAAITSVSLILEAGSFNFKQYSTATLYGIKNVTTATGTGKATGGDEIYTDGTYWYHKFTTVGTSSFTPLTALTVDYLVVAGGGGGGRSEGGGGGGAGGVRCTVGATGGGGSLESPLSLTAQAYTVTVGGGGAGGTSDRGTNGSNSVFASITSTGGGGGGGNGRNAPTTGNTGGSGGGGSAGPVSSGQAGGSGTTNQGYAGGSGFWTNTISLCGGGGGGAGQAGSNATSGSAGGKGGNGVTTSISGISTTYGGGGGGSGWATTAAGAGGTGGGGAGASGGAGTAGTANTGGGGGGPGKDNPTAAGGNGGSGIVIVRYAV